MEHAEIFFEFRALPKEYEAQKSELLPWKFAFFLAALTLGMVYSFVLASWLATEISVALLLSPHVGEYLLEAMIAGGLILSLLMGILISSTVLIVPQGFKLLTLTLGRFPRQHEPGLCWLFPLIERPVVWVSVQRQNMTVNTNETKSRDGITLSANVVLFFTIVDAVRAYFEVSKLASMLRKNIETISQEYLANFLIVQSDDTKPNSEQNFNRFVQRKLAYRFYQDYGVRIDSVGLTDFVIADEEVRKQLSAAATASVYALARRITSDGLLDFLANIKSAILNADPNITPEELERRMSEAYKNETLREFAVSSGNSPLSVFNVPNPTDSGKED